MSGAPAAARPGRMEAPPGPGGAHLTRRGPLLAALLAAALSLPGVGLPFLSDDWVLLEASGGTVPAVRTPFADFRPLFMGSLWLDRKVWGLSPGPMHLTNVILIAAAAALVVLLVRRYSGDARLAAGTGLLFALQPYHVENAAWIAARSDALAVVPLLLAAWAYDRWRERRQGVPVMAALLFEAALLAKETAIVLPPALVLIGLAVRSRRPGAGEWLRGHLLLALVAAGHFLVLRPRILGGPGRTLLQGFGIGWIKDGLGFAAAALVPLPVELLAAQPVLWASVALGAILVLLGVARARSGRIPGAVILAAALCGVLLLPALVGLQERYLFLPSVASCCALAALVRAARGGAAGILATLLVSGWLFTSWIHWSGWREAAAASRSLVDGLVQASQRPGVGEIVVANPPHRVGGGSVAGDFRAALLLSGGRPVPVRAASWISYATAEDDALDGPPGTAVRRPPAQPSAEVWLRIPRNPYSDFVGPGKDLVDAGKAASRPTPTGALLFDGRNGVRVRIDPDPARGRAAYAWVRGALRPLF